MPKPTLRFFCVINRRAFKSNEWQIEDDKNGRPRAVVPASKSKCKHAMYLYVKEDFARKHE